MYDETTSLFKHYSSLFKKKASVHRIYNNIKRVVPE